MDKKIREAFEKWDNDTFWGASSTEWAFEAGYLAAQAEHDAEVGELVEAFYESRALILPWLSTALEDDSVSESLHIAILSWLDSVKVLDNYCKINCPECNGMGCYHGLGQFGKCPTCKGNGKVWRKK